MSAREELIARTCTHLWKAWSKSDEDMGSEAGATLFGLGMLVPEGGAAELERLRLLQNAQPASLTPEQIEALANTGNRALNDHYHEDLCHCSDWPESCGNYFSGSWDTAAFGIGMAAVIGMWESMRAPAEADALAHARAQRAADNRTWQHDLTSLREAREENARLRARVAELETSARGCDGEGCILPHSSWCVTARRFAATHNGCTCGEPWKDTPQTHAGHCWLLSPPDHELEWHRRRVAELLARVAELETERHATNEALSDAAEQLRNNRDQIAKLEAERSTLLADRDAQIVAWLGKKAHEYGTSNAEKRAKAEAVSRMADKLSRGAVRRPLEDPHDSPLHHEYRLGHDLDFPEARSV